MTGCYRTFLTTVVFLLFPLFGAVAIDCAAGATEPIRIGAIAPLTGAYAAFGQAQKNAYLMAEKEINDKGGIKGRPIKVLIEDSQSKPEPTRAAAEKLILKDNVVGLIGEDSSGDTASMLQLPSVHKIPLLMAVPAADEFTQKGDPWVFRTCTPASKYPALIVNYAVENLKDIKTIGISFENTLFGTRTAEAAKAACQQKGIDVKVYEPYAIGTLDLRPILNRMKSADVDGVFLAASLNEAILFMRQAREVDLKPRAFLGGGMGLTMPEFIEGLGSDANYVITTAQWTQDVKWPGAAGFVENYAKKYGILPGYEAAESYVGIYVIADALERAGSIERQSVREALETVDIKNTAFGPIKFEKFENYTNQNRHDLLILQIQDKKFVTIAPTEYASGKLIYPVPR